MKLTRQLCLIILLISFNTSSFSLEKIFYVLHNKTSAHVSSANTIASLSQHTQSINLLISQAYHIDKKGAVTGFINPDIISFAHAHGIKLMAMITNRGFDKDSAHQFLSNAVAVKQAINSILVLCQQNHLYGIQFDFEMISIQDKNKLTNFYQAAATALHQKGYRVSFAVPPVISDGPFASSYQQRMYKIFGGAYDLKELGKSADFITVMTYDQHIGKVPPGSIAGIRWVETVIKHVLKFIPAQKLSLGIPVYSGFWYTSKNRAGQIAVRNDAISYETVQKLLKKNNAQLYWDNANKVHYTFYERYWLNQYIFIEDAQALKAKLALVDKYHLRGISVFRLGIEDPRIWTILSTTSLRAQSSNPGEHGDKNEKHWFNWLR
ncbi:MAG: glycosyl hydrolase family 18 protein [Gammaproteobacteria bacterium]